MGSRAPFVVGILAIAAVVAWLVLRGEDAQPTNPTPGPAGSADLTNPGKVATPQPSLPTEPGKPPELQPGLPPVPTADETFQEESRDDTWAKKTEGELAERWKKIRAGKLESTECRQTQCRMTIVGSEQDVGTAVADLEGPRGLHGYAKGVLLTGPQRNADGSISLRVFVNFER